MLALLSRRRISEVRPYYPQPVLQSLCRIGQLQNKDNLKSQLPRACVSRKLSPGLDSLAYQRSKNAFEYALGRAVRSRAAASPDMTRLVLAGAV
jgi:hypothetical protein